MNACTIFDLLNDSLFQNSTRTHCDVPNFAPSISAAIGSFIPQKYVWQACIALHSAPRFLFAFLYVHYFYERLSQRSGNRLLIKLNYWLNFIENMALLGLSLISSQEKFEVHKFCFTTFLVCSFCYMCLTYFLFARCGFVPQSRDEIKSMRYKKTILTVYLICVPLMILFYMRHNEYCEPNVYSYFCIFEYILVIANMCYHMTAYYDLKDVSIIVPRKETGYEFPKVSLLT